VKKWTLAFQILELTAFLGGWIMIEQAYAVFGELHSRSSIKERFFELAKKGFLKRTRRGVYRLTDKGKAYVESFAPTPTKWDIIKVFAIHYKYPR